MERRAFLAPSLEDPYATSAILDTAMAELGYTNAEVARFVGCHESIIREQRRALRTVTLPRVQRLPPALAVLVLRKMLRMFGED